MTSDRTPAAAWDAEYGAGRYRDEPPVAFVRDILAAARQAGAGHGLYVGRGNGRRPPPTLMAGEPSARTGGASRPPDEGNDNFLVWQLPAVNCSVNAWGRGFVPINQADNDRNEFRFASVLILYSQLLTLKNDGHPVE